MRAPRPLPQPSWVRPLLAAAVLLVALLTLVLNNCWCDPERLAIRLALVAFVAAVWLVDLFVRALPRDVLSVCVALPVGWLIFTDNGSVAALFLLLLVGWVMYTGTLREGLLDPRFYRRKYDAAKTIAAFGDTVRDEVELDQLIGHLIDVVHETMPPAHVALWLRPPATIGPGIRQDTL